MTSASAPRFFQAYVVDREPAGGLRAGLLRRDIRELGTSGVLLRVCYSSLNYKDALAAQAAPGIVKTLPHVPGIDACGYVVGEEAAGPMLVTGYGLGTEIWGGYGDYVRLPAEWLLPIPAGLSPRDSMILGTAGLTAALSVTALLDAGLDPGRGEVLVTGATGGVGMLAVMLLAHLGFRVVAQTRKPEAASVLTARGAAAVVTAERDGQGPVKPLHKIRWAGAIDTVGGPILAQVLREVGYGGTVATCGMVAGTDFTSSVFPFILRAARLIGIDSVQCPRALRETLWARLATVWRLPDLALIAPPLHREGLTTALAALRRGERMGRTLVIVGGDGA